VKSPVSKYTPAGGDVDSFIEAILVISGKRIQIEQDQIPNYFWPVTGKYRMRDIHKTFVDDESYNDGHGKAYEFYGVDPKAGALAIVRPDQCESMSLNE
jgi:phenol 2-monooxygenase